MDAAIVGAAAGVLAGLGLGLAAVQLTALGLLGFLVWLGATQGIEVVLGVLLANLYLEAGLLLGLIVGGAAHRIIRTQIT